MSKQAKTIDYQTAAECLKVLAHPGRLQLVDILMQDQRHSVGELAELTQMPANTCSEHLRLLERCGLLRGERESRTVYYTIAEPHLCNMMECIGSRFAS